MRTRKKRSYDKRTLSSGKPPNYLGQHFMHNKQMIREIVAHANVSGKDTVLELGAGKGALTFVLNEQAGKVLAVEYDGRLADILKSRMLSNTSVIQQDIMKLRLPREKFIVVSNIPYAITTPIMKLLLSNPNSHLQRGVIVMEKGAARRFTSPFIKDAYVIGWRMWFDIHYVRNIAKDNFSPPPKVDSALITIKRKSELLIELKDYARFHRLAAFGLKHPYQHIDHAFIGVFTRPQMTRLRRSLNIQSDTLVGALNEKHWGIIFDTMVRYVPRIHWP